MSRDVAACVAACPGRGDAERDHSGSERRSGRACVVVRDVSGFVLGSS